MRASRRPDPPGGSSPLYLGKLLWQPQSIVCSVLTTMHNLPRIPYGRWGWRRVKPVGQIIPLKREGALEPRRQQFRQDVRDLLHMLQIIKESELGRAITPSELVPIDITKLVSELGVRIEEVEELESVIGHNPWTERDTKVPGFFDRRGKRIIVAKRQSLEVQRYTIGHEIAHLMYHSGPHHLRELAVRVRDRGIVEESESSNHKCEEREAEIFAAELTMPADLVREAMLQRFGAAIDGTVPREELAHFLNATSRQKIDSYKLARMPQEERAALFAEAKSFAGRAFEPLYRQFCASKQAMAIRLLELGLVI